MLTPAAPYRLLVPLPADIPPEKRAMLRRIEAAVWTSVLLSLLISWAAHLLIDLTGQGAPAAAGWHLAAALGPGVPVTVLILRFAFARSVAQARQEKRLHDLEAREARLDGALLVARTVAHRINNAISPVAGYAELLTQDSGAVVDPRTHAYATLIAEAAAQTVQEVRSLQRIVRLEEDPTSPISILDVEASITDPSPVGAGAISALR